MIISVQALATASCGNLALIAPTLAVIGLMDRAARLNAHLVLRASRTALFLSALHQVGVAHLHVLFVGH